MNLAFTVPLIDFEYIKEYKNVIKIKIIFFYYSYNI